MGGIYLGRIFGIPFYIHWSWFLVVFLIASSVPPVFFPQFRGQPVVFYGLGLLAALGLFASVLLHELGHAVVSQRQGIPVRAIRLFFFGGVAEITGDPRKPWHEILMALGGPAVTAVLIILYLAGMALIIAATGGEWVRTQEGAIGTGIDSRVAKAGLGLLSYLRTVNVILLIFNLIPAFPLDGGRVLRAILWSWTGSYLKGTGIAGTIGVGFSWVLILYGIVVLLPFLGVLLPFLGDGGFHANGIWFIILGIFLNNAAQSSIAYAQIQHSLQGLYVRDVMNRQPISIPADVLLSDVVENYFFRFPFKTFPVEQNGRFLGVLTLRSLQNVDRQEWTMLRAGDLVQRARSIPTLSPDEPVLSALRKMTESDHSRLPVLEAGQLAGLLSRRDIMNFLEIRAGLAETPRRRVAEPLDVVAAGPRER